MIFVSTDVIVPLFFTKVDVNLQLNAWKKIQDKRSILKELLGSEEKLAIYYRRQSKTKRSKRKLSTEEVFVDRVVGVEDVNSRTVLGFFSQ